MRGEGGANLAPEKPWARTAQRCQSRAGPLQSSGCRDTPLWSALPQWPGRGRSHCSPEVTLSQAQGTGWGGLTSPHPGLAGSCKGLVPHHAATISWPLRGGLQGAAALTPPTRANQAWVSSLTLSSTLSTPSGWTASCMCPETQAPLLRQTCRRGPRRAARAHSFNHVFPCVRTDRRKTHVSRPQRPSPASCSLQFKR